MFRRKPRIAEPYKTWIEDLAAEQRKAGNRWYGFDPKDSTAGRRVNAASPEDQRGFVLGAMKWLDHRGRKQQSSYHEGWVVRQTMLTLLRRRLPFEHDDIVAMLDWSIRQPYTFVRGTAQMIKAVQDYLKEHELTPVLQDRISSLAEILESGYTTAETRRWAAGLKELGGLTTLPLEPGEVWSDSAIEEIEEMDAETRLTWVELLNLCAKASGAKPTARWSREAGALLERIGRPAFESAVLRWFALVDGPRTRPVERLYGWQPDPNLLIQDKNADILRGLAWLCAGSENAEVARALTALALSAYRKVPQLGPRCVRVGNACVLALGNMSGTEGIGQLALLKIRVRFATAQKAIDKALANAAEREGLPPDEIEEMSVPAYGLQEVGIRRERLGQFGVELVVIGTSTSELRWIKPDGKRQKSVPKVVKDHHAGKLKALKAVAKDIQRMLPAQRDRIENLYLEQKVWRYPVWRERYLDHPLVGTLARRLIWRFSSGDRARAGVFHDGRIVGRDGRALDWLDDSTLVEMWHPLQETSDEVLGWRDWLAELEIRQPFKQAHREVYLLTDAERTTRTYSNRFAAHIIKQHQFNALCGARGWRNKLRLMVDDEYPPAAREIPAWGLRAEFWVEGIGENYGTDTTEAGTYLYLATDQVRFYRMDAPVNYSHAAGGGYFASGTGRDVRHTPLLLEEIPPLVLSEVMRDVDLFVGVASVGNDPNWSDGGPEGRFRDYWTSYSFGGLSETARTRKQVLLRLIPRLKIADRCRMTERFLVVQGDVRTYKIHLGSGNVLMEPNDQYLCIVPARGTANGDFSDKVFLPFEGDRVLAIILSKAFLLSEDRKIADPTILHQIAR
ncbi:MAG TPA: DUF4132 domain-containing protein [Rubrobacter sp.]|nr:DUF4132 domain-containing protein [Rubrobacter sp.]